MTVLGEDTTLLEAFRSSNSVLQGAVAGIAEVINVPGLVNVDFADVRTLMSENGMAMMGSASASGPDRAQDRRRERHVQPLAGRRESGRRARRAGEHQFNSSLTLKESTKSSTACSSPLKTRP